MTSEQLQATRAIRWRQSADPILTLEDAQAFLQQAGLCLFLPRKAQLNAPAPSFVEACLGQTNPTPPRAAIEAARELLSRLIGGNLAVPLNLLGTPADHPDFVVSPDTLPFVFAMRGDRDWKHAPGSGTTRVSPLVQQVWKVLERKGVLSADELKDEIGRELTEAAALRALYELWGSMRVTPLYQNDGEATLWEALQTRQSKALNAGTNMSQVTALSVLVSLYLESAVAATSDEVEIFLSPLTSRSKVREAVRGLTATRQLAMIPMERETLLYVEGSLPEFDEATGTDSAATAPVSDTASTSGFVPRRSPRRPVSRPGERPSLTISAKPKLPDTISVWPRPVVEAGPPAPDPAAVDAERPSPRPPARSAPRPPTRSAARPADGSIRGTDAQTTPRTRPAERTGIRSFSASGSAPRRERTPARPPWKDKGKPGFAKSAAAKGEKARWPRERAPGGPPRTDGPRADFKPRGDSKPRPDFKPRGDFKPPGEFKPRGAPGARGDARPGASGGGFKPRRDFNAASDKKPRTFRPAGERGERPPFARSSKPREGGGDFKPRADFKPRGEFKPRGDFKDFKARKPGDFKRSNSAPSGSGARAGGFKPSGGGYKSAGARPPFSRAKSGEGARPGGEFRQPWKDAAGKSSAPRPPYQRAAGRGPAGPRPSPPRDAEGTPSERPAFKGGFKKPGAAAGAKPAFKSGAKFGSRPPSRAAGGFSARPPQGDRPASRGGEAGRSSGSSFKGPRQSGPGAFGRSGPGGPSRPPSRAGGRSSGGRVPAGRGPGGPPRKRKPE